MANYLGFSLGDVERNVESIKGARENRKSVTMQNEAAQRRNLLVQSPEYQSTVQDAAKGDVTAQQRFLQMDPENAPKFIEAAQKMTQAQRDQAQENVTEIAKMSAWILQAPEAERPARYMQVRDALPEQSRASFPEQYDQGFVTLSINKARDMKEILAAPTVQNFGGEDVMYNSTGQELGRATKPENPTSVRIGGEDRLYQNGQEIDRQTRPENTTGGTGGGRIGGLSPADENYIMRAVVTIQGGTVDQNNNITQLNPEQRNQGQAIMTEAARLLSTGEAMNRADAVTQAAKAFGLRVPTVLQQQIQNDPANPSNITNYLMNN